jgi:spore coat polysaccharide biosynthesis predicted glycosyltransferase SpsG
VKKRLVFRIIGNKQVGMGHIYRALTLAREFSDHEVLFVTDLANQIVVESLLKEDYWVGVYEVRDVTKQIRSLKPDAVIYDALDTSRQDIEEVRRSGAVVISFEDLGDGAHYTDLTVNELFDKPQFEGDHILWGHDYFFLRDEFETVQTHRFEKSVDGIMLAFGGTDQHNLSRIVFRAIKQFCKKHRISIHIVTGPGYRGYDSLESETAKEEGVYLTHASGVISSIMEQVQLAITSNGRTVYEFAHMNIPSIVIAQHDREITHAFADETNGFIQLGLYQPRKTSALVLSALERMVQDTEFRRLMYRRISAFNFNGNKRKIAKILLQLIEGTRD